MTQLAPNLFQRRFPDLIEIGRSSIPALAPQWTDQNAHDPGITLMELLAWVAEAQLYSLSRMRRDERSAYATLLGIKRSGTQSSEGMIWPNHDDPNSPAAAFLRSIVVAKDARITIAGTDRPVFTPVSKLLWVAGRIEKLWTRFASGSTVDQTDPNEKGTVFLPFGEKAGSRDVFSMTFACRDRAGIFGASRLTAKNAYWPIGVRVASNEGANAASCGAGCSTLTARFIAGDESVDLKILSDTTRGLLQTGFIALDLDNVATSPAEFTIEFRAKSNFDRPPRLIRFEPNVIPIRQGSTISEELHDANELPDLAFVLDQPGLSFAAGEEPIDLRILDNGALSEWRRCRNLSDHGPHENVYEFDTQARQVAFGNDVNGRIPPANSQISVSYKVCDGESGNVASNRQWSVSGFEGVFGINPDPVSGGEYASDFDRQRRQGRQIVREKTFLVSSEDIEKAAQNLFLLDVARAWVVVPPATAPFTGTTTLVVICGRDADTDGADASPETAKWLAAIERQLRRRTQLGLRLKVVGVSYRDFSIRVIAEVQPGLSPAEVEKAIRELLLKQLALTGPSPRSPGVPVNKRDVAAWIRGVDGVNRIIDLSLRDVEGAPIDTLKVPKNGLPRWKERESTIDVRRAGFGGGL